MRQSKQILILLSLFLFIYSSGIAQGWEKVFPHTDNGIFDSPQIIATDDGGSVILTRLPFSSDTSYLAFVRLDNEGQLLWTRHYGLETASTDFKLTEDGNYLSISPNGGFSAFVLKTDEAGNVIDSLFYNTPLIGGNSTFQKAIFEVNGNQYLILGTPSASVNSNTVPYLILDDGSNISTTYVEVVPNEIINLQSSTKTLDDNLLLFGYSYPENNVDSSDLFLSKVSYTGDIIWTKDFDFEGRDNGMKIVAMPDSSFLGLVYTNQSIGSESTMRLVRFDKDGTYISDNIIATNESVSNGSLEMTLTNDGGVFVAWDTNGGGDFHFKMLRADSVGNVIWFRDDFGFEEERKAIYSIAQSKDGGFYAVGVVDELPSGFPIYWDLYLIKTDSLGNSLTNFVHGNVYYDTSNNCAFDPLEKPLGGWIVSAYSQSDDSYFYGTTDAHGDYEILTDTGAYTIKVYHPNAYWNACWEDSIINMSTFFDTTFLDFPIQAEYDCSILNVDVSTPHLRRCFDNIYYANYCNEGTAAAENAYIEIEFDEWITIDSSSLPWSSVNGNIYTFGIGDIEVGECGGFQINVSLDCDSTFLGQTHCVSAHIYPDSICLPSNTNWDGSTISVEAECIGDTIEFTIQNIGLNPMSETKTYIVIEDEIIHLNGTFQLDVMEFKNIKVPVDTSFTYRLEAQQSSFHPTSTAPSVAIEGCGIQLPISLGFVNNYSQDDADPFVSIDCQENIGSFDPNDKRGFPEGIGAEHIIYEDTELEYHIRFQNTGTDTAFLVVIRDTLSEFLDPTTIRPEASSHPYTWTLLNNGALKFTFDNIMLPDSNINEPLSHGFVKFKIKQHLNNPPGTIINNQSGIYFDFNAPVITNETMHKIDDKEMISDTMVLRFCDSLFYQQFYANDTSITSTSNQLSWEITTTNEIQLNHPYDITVDAFVHIGEPFGGEIYDMDTMIVNTYTASNGCDSMVTINLQLITSNEDLNHFITGIKLFPNPARQQTQLAVTVKEDNVLSFALRNSLGQLLANKRFSQKVFEGRNIISINLVGLSDGIYWLEIKGEKGAQLVKVVVSQD